MGLDRSLPDRAEVVIIGGGVMGASAAFHLAEAGVTDVVLLEADELSCGSTSKSAGGVRLQFSDEINIALALRSMDAFERFGQRPGADIGLHQVGYLFLLTDPDDVTVFEKNTELQNSMGVDSRMLSPDEAGELSPLANVDDVLAASFCGRDGHATPEAVVLGYASAARAREAGRYPPRYASPRRGGRAETRVRGRAPRRRRRRPGPRRAPPR